MVNDRDSQEAQSLRYRNKNVDVTLFLIPYSISVPAEIAKHLLIKNMETDSSNEFTAQTRGAGAVDQVYINYKADDGKLHGFAGAYYFSKADIEKSQYPSGR